MMPAWNGEQAYPQPGNQYPYFNTGVNVPYYGAAWPQAAPPGQTPSMLRPKHLLRHTTGAFPFATGTDPTTIGPAGHTPMPRPKHLAGNGKKPLKSAMKKVQSPFHNPNALPFEQPPSGQRYMPEPLGRQRTNSLPRFVPDHIFLSFIGTNEFCLENVHAATLDHVQEQILSMWPHGVDFVTNQGSKWRARFRQNPWAGGGVDGILARRMIIHLFSVLGRHGYHHLTSVETGNPSPRLVFVDTDADRASRFFIASFSRSGRQVNFIDPPPHIGETIGESLRLSLPHKIASSHVDEHGVYTVELRRNAFGTAVVDRTHFLSHILKQINSMGFRLEASVTLAKSGILGFGNRQELWVFKGKA